MLLEYLSERPGVLVSTEELLRQVWGYHEHSQTRTVANTVARLRAKVEQNPSEPRYILTVHGGGYVFEPPAETEAMPAPAAPTEESSDVRYWTDGVPGLAVLWRSSGFSAQVLAERRDLRLQLVRETGRPVAEAIRGRWEQLSAEQREIVRRLFVLPGGAAVEDLVKGALQPLLDLIRDGWLVTDALGRNHLRKGFLDVLPDLCVSTPEADKQRLAEARRLAQTMEKIWTTPGRTTEDEIWTAREWPNLEALSAAMEGTEPRLAGSLLLGVMVARMQEGVEVSAAIERSKRVAPKLPLEDVVRLSLDVLTSYHEWGAGVAAERLDRVAEIADRMGHRVLWFSARMARLAQNLADKGEMHSLHFDPIEGADDPAVADVIASLYMVRALRWIGVGAVETGLAEGERAIAKLSSGIPASGAMAVCAMVACMYARLGMVTGADEWVGRFRTLNTKSGLHYRDGALLLEAEVAAKAPDEAIERWYRLKDRMILNNNHRGVATVKWHLCLCHLDRGEFAKAAQVVGDVLGVGQVPTIARGQYLLMHTLSALHTGDRVGAQMSLRLQSEPLQGSDEVVLAILRQIVLGEVVAIEACKGPTVVPLLQLHQALVSRDPSTIISAVAATEDAAHGLMIVRVIRRWISREHGLSC